MDRSSRRSRCHETAAAIGHSRPTVTSAGRTPDRSITKDATNAPSPINRATKLSRTPKTRASTSSGAILASSVNAARSISALPTPTQASRPNAAASCGKRPMSVTGRPHMATPTANHVPNRRVPTSSDAASEPRTAPAPTAAVSVPTPGSPVPSRSMATTTVNTVSAPRVNVCAAARPMMSATSRFRMTARIPSAASFTRWVFVGADGRGGASYRSRSSKAAAHKEAPAAKANTTVTPVNWSSTAASSGPTNVATESSSPRTTLALASSYPVRHSEGSNAEWAGRKRVAAIVDNAASA